MRMHFPARLLYVKLGIFRYPKAGPGRLWRQKLVLFGGRDLILNSEYIDVNNKNEKQSTTTQVPIP